MVIKFRENRISMLEKNLKTAGTEPLAESVNNKVEEDIAAMKQQMEQYPQVSRLDHELHNLRAQLADAPHPSLNTTATLLDANRLAQLEQAYRDLQATSRRGERSSVISTQKLREKMEALEDENQKLKKQLTEERQAWETKEAGLQAELTATNKMNKDLERVLEANHLKHRIERDALTNLHCHTLKESNNSLQERLNEYEADMLRLQQQVGQLDLKNASLTELLQAQSMLETVSLELEEAAKDKEQVTELLDTQRLEVAFLEERSAKLEAALQLETTAHHTTTAKLQEAMQQQVMRVQDLKSKLTAMEDEAGSCEGTGSVSDHGAGQPSGAV
nr:hypothetical protein BaRGS_033981 [Batillaria attramentaria]